MIKGKKTAFTILVFTLGLFVLSQASLVSSAENTITPEGYNFFTNIQYKLSQLGLFTAAGQSRQCDINARHTFYVDSGDSVGISEFYDYCGNSESYLVDAFDSSWNFKGEYNSETMGSGLSSSSDGQIWELYCCPYSPCETNVDCSDSPASNYGDTCNANYGSCYFSIPTHNTKLYDCISSNWDYSGTSSYGQDRFCLDSSNKNYLDKNGGEHCTSTPSDSWCATSTSNNQGSCSDLGTDINACYDRADCMWTRYSTCQTLDNAQCSGMREKDCVQDTSCEWAGTTCGFKEVQGGTENEISGVTLQAGITQGEVQFLTGSTLLNSICSSELICESGSTCVAVANIIDGGNLTESKSEIIRKSYCDAYDGEFFIKWLTAGLIDTDSDEYNRACDAIGGKQDYFESSFGVCITNYSPSNGVQLEKYFGWAAFVNITGDKGVDGLIISFLMLFLLIIIMKK